MAWRRVDCAPIDVVDAEHVGDEETVEEAALRRLTESGDGGRAEPMSKRLHLGAFMRPISQHTGAWRYPGAYPDANFNFGHIGISPSAWRPPSSTPSSWPIIWPF